LTASEIISKLRDHGVEVLVAGDRLKLRAPTEPPAEARPLIEELKRCKDEVLGILTSWPGPCYCCGEIAWWLHREGGPPVCGRCHPPGAPELVRGWIPQAACGWRGPCH
jgi:hypothetical protein